MYKNLERPSFPQIPLEDRATKKKTKKKNKNKNHSGHQRAASTCFNHPPLRSYLRNFLRMNSYGIASKRLPGSTVLQSFLWEAVRGFLTVDGPLYETMIASVVIDRFCHNHPLSRLVVMNSHVRSRHRNDERVDRCLVEHVLSFIVSLEPYCDADLRCQYFRRIWRQQAFWRCVYRRTLAFDDLVSTAAAEGVFLKMKPPAGATASSATPG